MKSFSERRAKRRNRSAAVARALGERGRRARRLRWIRRIAHTREQDLEGRRAREIAQGLDQPDPHELRQQIDRGRHRHRPFTPIARSAVAAPCTTPHALSWSAAVSATADRVAHRAQSQRGLPTNVGLPSRSRARTGNRVRRLQHTERMGGVRADAPGLSVRASGPPAPPRSRRSLGRARGHRAHEPVLVFEQRRRAGPAWGPRSGRTRTRRASASRPGVLRRASERLHKGGIAGPRGQTRGPSIGGAARGVRAIAAVRPARQVTERRDQRRPRRVGLGAGLWTIAGAAGVADQGQSERGFGRATASARRAPGPAREWSRGSDAAQRAAADARTAGDRPRRNAASPVVSRRASRSFTAEARPAARPERNARECPSPIAGRRAVPPSPPSLTRSSIRSPRPQSRPRRESSRASSAARTPPRRPPTVHSAGLLQPYRPTVGHPTAPARCSGPVSFPT